RGSRGLGGLLKRRGPGAGGRIVYSIEDQLISSVRLPSPLGPEPKQVHAAFAIEGFERGCFALDPFPVEQGSARQRISILRIRYENSPLKTGLRLKGGAAFEHHYRIGRHAPKPRMSPVAQLDP